MTLQKKIMQDREAKNLKVSVTYSSTGRVSDFYFSNNENKEAFVQKQILGGNTIN